MLKKTLLSTLAAGAALYVATPAAAEPDFCFSCIKEFGTGQTVCEIIPCSGGGGGTAAVPQDNRR